MKNKITPTPKQMPRPTYWPFLLALGCTLFFWGIITTIAVTLIGALVFAVALGGWIYDLFVELKETPDHEL